MVARHRAGSSPIISAWPIASTPKSTISRELYLGGPADHAFKMNCFCAFNDVIALALRTPALKWTAEGCSPGGGTGGGFNPSVSACVLYLYPPRSMYAVIKHRERVEYPHDGLGRPGASGASADRRQGRRGRAAASSRWPFGGAPCWVSFVHDVHVQVVWIGGLDWIGGGKGSKGGGSEVSVVMAVRKPCNE